MTSWYAYLGENNINLEGDGEVKIKVRKFIPVGYFYVIYKWNK